MCFVGFLGVFLVLFWYFFRIFCCLPHSTCCLSHPVLTTCWLRCFNSKPATFAEGAAANTTFINADLTITATTLGGFLSVCVPRHRLLQPWEVSPKFLLELVPLTGLPDVATSELCLFPRGDKPELQSSVRKPAALQHGAAAGGRALGFAAIHPGTHSDMRFLLGEDDLERDC